MPSYIVHLPNGSFLEWSSIVDAPTTYAMTEEELRGYMLEEYGRRGTEDLDARIARAKETGTSARGMTLESLISGNRSGPEETELTLEQIMIQYKMPEEEPSGGNVAPD